MPYQKFKYNFTLFEDYHRYVCYLLYALFKRLLVQQIKNEVMKYRNIVKINNALKSCEISKFSNSQ